MATSSGVWYWLDGYSESHGAHLVRYGPFMDWYAYYDYQCGWLGAPLSDEYFTGRGWRQDFEGGWIANPMV